MLNIATNRRGNFGGGGGGGVGRCFPRRKRKLFEEPLLLLLTTTMIGRRGRRSHSSERRLKLRRIATHADSQVDPLAAAHDVRAALQVAGGVRHHRTVAVVAAVRQGRRRRQSDGGSRIGTVKRHRRRPARGMAVGRTPSVAVTLPATSRTVERIQHAVRANTVHLQLVASREALTALRAAVRPVPRVEAHMPVAVRLLRERLGAVHARAADVLRKTVRLHLGEVGAVGAADEAACLFHHRRSQPPLLTGGSRHVAAVLTVVVVVKQGQVIHAAVT